MISELECVCNINGHEVLIELVNDASTYHILHNGDKTEVMTEDFINNILDNVNQIKDDYCGFELFKRVFSIYCAYLK